MAEVHIDGKTVGHIDINSFEFDFDELARLADESAEYNPISKYPTIVRDIAVFVPPNEKSGKCFGYYRKHDRKNYG